MGDLVPLQPNDTVFPVGRHQYALVRKAGQEYVMAPIEQHDGYYYKDLASPRYFPESLIGGISDQAGFVRAHQLPGYSRKDEGR